MLRFFRQIKQIYYLLGQKDQQIAENIDEINEKINRVPDVIFVSKTALSDDQLSVIKNKSAHNGKSNIEVHLELKHRIIFISFTLLYNLSYLENQIGSNDDISQEQKAEQ